MVKEESLLEGKRLRGEAERPLGETKAGLVIGEVKLDLSWLAIGEAEAMTLLWSKDKQILVGRSGRAERVKQVIF